MADALVSPTVGAAAWAASAGLVGLSAHRVRRAGDDRLVPMMGVMGAFVFVVQMINFSIPGTGSSGHLGGGLLLAILLGPHAALLVMASILTAQALFFADGGLLALGCNIFNLGFLPAFIAFPCIYRPLAGRSRSGWRPWAAAIVAAIVGLQLGSLGVVLQTTLSGISGLSFTTFLMVMQPIHLAIGVAEGLATGTLVAFVARVRPDLFPEVHLDTTGGRLSGRIVATVFAGGLLLAVIATNFSSILPDGLEWSIARTAGHDLTAPVGDVHAGAAALQERTAWLPDYGFRGEKGPAASLKEHAEDTRPGDVGAPLSAIVGGAIVLLIGGGMGYLLRKFQNAAP